MLVRTIAYTAGPENGDPVVPPDTVGEVVGDGYEEDGQMYVAVDFGNIACDVLMEDLEPVNWSEVGSG